MPLRTVLLRVMLWSLALAALTGVVSVLTRSGSFAWRVVGTGITTAVACALLLPASAAIDRVKTRQAGLLGMAGVVVEFLLALTLIWEAPRSLWGISCEDEIALTMVFSGLAVLVLMSLLMLLRESYGAVAARVGIGVALAAYAGYLVAIWLPRQGRYGPEEDWMESATAVVLLGGLAVLAMVGLGTADRRPWRWAGILASIVACAMWLLDIWIGSGSDLGHVLFCAFLSLAVVVAHANLCCFCTLAPGHRWVRAGTIVAAGLTAGLIVAMVIDDRFFGVRPGFHVLGRFSAAGGIMAGCGTLALLVLARLTRRVEYEPALPELTEITVVCPRCREKQLISLGDSACTTCRLRISVRIEDPRCPQCDYLLYGLTADRCPECGTVIGDAPGSRGTPSSNPV